MTAAANFYDRLLTPGRQKAVRDSIIISGVIVAVLAGAMSFAGRTVDIHAYYVNRPPVTYGAMPGIDDAYLYTPAFAQLLSPFTALLPYVVFKGLWLTLMILTLRWLTGPLLLLPAVILFYGEIEAANLHFFIAAAIVIGFRYPWTWALMLLTKVTPGVGLIWFAVRREWRKLAIALGVTGAIALVSFALGPQQWFDYIAFIERGFNYKAPTVLLPGPFWLRAGIAAAITAFAALTNRKWLVPVAAVVALPHGTVGIAMLAGSIPLLRQRNEEKSAAAKAKAGEQAPAAQAPAPQPVG
jgi:hypothetical protein